MTKSTHGRSEPFSRPIQPSRNEPCFCGSGKKFKHCCLPRMPVTDGGRGMYAALEAGNFAIALTECRAFITQYTIWHKSHTCRILRDAPSLGRPLLEIDIRAMSSLLDSLLRCSMKLGITSDFPATLERLRGNIDSVEWQRKIIYFHALVAMWPDWDESRGRKELSKLGSVSEEKDVEILQLYLDIFSDELKFSQSQELIDRILQFTESDVDRLHYRGLRAVKYLIIGDDAKAEEELSSAISEFKTAKEGQIDSDYEKDRLAMSLDLLGALKKDPKLLDEAIGLYKELLEAGNCNAFGKAGIFKRLGDTYRSKAAWTEASDAYRNALDAAPMPIARIFLSECHLRLEGAEKAFATISIVDPGSLDRHEYADYVFVFAAISIEGADRIALQNAETLLRGLKVEDPIFLERRNSLLLDVIDTQHSGKSSSAIQRARNALRGLAGAASRYLKLEPNVFGIGINLGRILEDVSKGSNQHTS